jgi:hypothetical protein
MAKINKKKAGFSLIELLFAILFLSVIVFGVIKLQTSNLTLSNTKQLELKAHSYAGQALEIASSLGLGKVMSCTIEPCYLKKTGDVYDIKNAGGPSGHEFLDGDLFERTIERDETGLTGATLVTATVKWTDSAGAHDVSAKRVIFN